MSQYDRERQTFNMIDKVDNTLRMVFENQNIYDREKSEL